MIYRLTVITGRRMCSFQQVLGTDDHGDKVIVGVNGWKDVSSPYAPLPPDLMGQQAQDLFNVGQVATQVATQVALRPPVKIMPTAKPRVTKPRSKAPLVPGIIPIGHNAMWDMR